MLPISQQFYATWENEIVCLEDKQLDLNWLNKKLYFYNI